MAPPRLRKASASPARYLSGWNCPCRGKRRHRPRVEGGERSPGHEIDILEAGAVGGLASSLQQVRGLPGSQEQVAVDAAEVAIDSLSCEMASMRSMAAAWLSAAKSAPLHAVDPLDFGEAVVDGVGQVGGRALGLSAGDGPVVQHDDALAFAGQQVGRGQPGDSRPDHADVRLLRPSPGIDAGGPRDSIQTDWSLLAPVSPCVASRGGSNESAGSALPAGHDPRMRRKRRTGAAGKRVDASAPQGAASIKHEDSKTSRRGSCEKQRGPP